MIGLLEQLCRFQNMLVIVRHDLHFRKVSIDFIMHWLPLPMISIFVCTSVEGDC